jgi:outer membrane protein assembly factor BamD (BamD/ComL family)
MKIQASSITALLLATSVTVFLTSCSNPESDLKTAEQANTEQAFQQFIQKHPESPLVAQAQRDQEKVVYEVAMKAGTSSSFKTFLQRFPKSPLADQASAEWERAEYDQAGRAGTVAAYEAFLKQFPSGAHGGQAKSNLEGAEFAGACAQPSIPTWHAFLDKYPESSHAAAATSNLCELAFQQAANANTVSNLEAFLREFPGTQRSQAALEKLAPLIFKDVVRSNTIPAYEVFLKRFGSTRTASQASDALARLEYQVATNEDSIDAYETFLKGFRNSEFATDVSNRLAGQVDDKDWNKALLEDAHLSYREYFRRHPETAHLRLSAGPAELVLIRPLMARTKKLTAGGFSESFIPITGNAATILPPPPDDTGQWTVRVQYNDGTSETFDDAAFRRGISTLPHLALIVQLPAPAVYKLSVLEAEKLELTEAGSNGSQATHGWKWELARTLLRPGASPDAGATVVDVESDKR